VRINLIFFLKKQTKKYFEYSVETMDTVFMAKKEKGFTHLVDHL
jgi:hypothetical protein